YFSLVIMSPPLSFRTNDPSSITQALEGKVSARTDFHFSRFFPSNSISHPSDSSSLVSVYKFSPAFSSPLVVWWASLEDPEHAIQIGTARNKEIFMQLLLKDFLFIV